MRIGCPDCDAAYEVPDAQIPPGRIVQCVRCGGRWRPAGVAPAPAPEPEPEPEPEAPAPQATLRHHSAAPIVLVSAAPVAAARSGGAVWGLAWGASLCALVAAGLAFAHFRGVIMHGWPATVRLYDLLGAS